jgi:hypothetical protein
VLVLEVQGCKRLEVERLVCFYLRKGFERIGVGRENLDQVVSG